MSSKKKSQSSDNCCRDSDNTYPLKSLGSLGFRLVRVLDSPTCWGLTAKNPNKFGNPIRPPCKLPETQSLKDIVQCFITNYRPRVNKEARFYKTQPNLENAITVAALALINGKRYPHQRRIPQAVLEQARDQLLSVSADLNNSTCFRKVFTIVEREIRSIKGIGELTVYDTAYRIGLYLDLEPESVYIHAGTRKGARAIGINVRQKKSIPVKDLPAPFAVLKPSEIEDCLCIYKDELEKLRGG